MESRAARQEAAQGGVQHGGFGQEDGGCRYAAHRFAQGPDADIGRSHGCLQGPGECHGHDCHPGREGSEAEAVHFNVGAMDLRGSRMHIAELNGGQAACSILFFDTKVLIGFLCSQKYLPYKN